VDLLIVRHAIAKDRAGWGADGRPDDERPLTERGRSRMKRNAAGIVSACSGIDVVATSPFARAADTAHILARALRCQRVVELDALAPGGSRERLMHWLGDRGEDERIALVGHEPDLGMLVSWLVAGAGSAPMEMKKGGACLLVFDGLPACGRGELRWFLPPALLRKLAR
jgi:phosphohistidine phosphatase